PRHLRDVFVTEYGIADVRGKSDADVIAAMLGVSDSRFQDELSRAAKGAGKLPKNYEIPGAYRENFPERIVDALKPAREAGLLRTGDAADQACLARLGLERPATFSERAYRALVSAALAR